MNRRYNNRGQPSYTTRNHLPLPLSNKPHHWHNFRNGYRVQKQCYAESRHQFEQQPTFQETRFSMYNLQELNKPVNSPQRYSEYATSNMPSKLASMESDISSNRKIMQNVQGQTYQVANKHIPSYTTLPQNSGSWNTGMLKDLFCKIGICYFIQLLIEGTLK